MADKKRSGIVKYDDVDRQYLDRQYLDRRQLRKSAGWILLWALGVGAVILNVDEAPGRLRKLRMFAPLIGVTTYGQNEERHHTLPREYADAIRRAGGIPLLLTPGETQIEPLLDALDGLILAGGGDICPDLYQGPSHESIYMTDEERDKTELALTRAALARETPILGICRGIQLLNIALGGALHAHLPDVVGEQVVHRLPPREPTEHVVNVLRSSRLAELLMGENLANVASDVEEIKINAASWHHQAISQAAPGLTVVARAADGVIEAVESENHPWLFAVQWHPELTAAHDLAQQRLFDTFIQATIENKH